MTHKRSRSIQEKIKECLDHKVCNLHPNVYKKLYIDLLNVPEATNVAKCKAYVSKLLNIPEMGKGTKEYWISRGWSDVEAHVKSKDHCSTYSKRVSSYSVEFWTSKINPNTGTNYTLTEADYERNSRRPIKKEYWIKLGYSEYDAENKAKETKNKNNKKGASKAKTNVEIHKHTSKRCKEYWISRGYNEIEAIQKVSEEQATFTLEKCIEKYGEEKGRERWLTRQEKWLEQLNSKSEDEKIKINRKKATKINYKTLWNKDLKENGIFYLLKVSGNSETFYKVGITTKSVRKRYSGNIIGDYTYTIEDTIYGNIHDMFLLEQKTIKQNKNITYIPNKKFEGWTECFYEKPIIHS